MDPGENAEGERWLLCSGQTINYPCDNGTTLLIFTKPYFQHFQILFDLPPGWPAPGVWSLAIYDDPNEYYEYFPDGDDASGRFILGAASPPPPPGNPALSQDSKDFFSHATNYLTIGSGGFGAAAAYTALSNPPLAAGLGVMTGLLVILAGEANELALDPPDPNYMVFATATPYPVPNPPSDPCLNNLATTLADLIGRTQAAVTSANRMQGALVAGDNDWAIAQGQALLDFAGPVQDDLSAAIDTDPNPWWSCVPAVRTVTADDIHAFEQGLAANGLPPDLLAQLQALGITDIQNATGLLYVQDPDLVAAMFNAVFGSAASRPFYSRVLDNQIQEKALQMQPLQPKALPR